MKCLEKYSTTQIFWKQTKEQQQAIENRNNRANSHNPAHFYITISIGYWILHADGTWLNELTNESCNLCLVAEEAITKQGLGRALDPRHFTK